MNNNLLNSIGLGNLDIGIVLIVLLVLLIAAIVLIIVCIVKITKLNKKYSRFMKGKKASSLEEEIFRMFEENKSMSENIRKNTLDIKYIEEKMRFTYQKMGMVKYDAFDQMGGKLSFCITLLDDENNGFMLNSVHNTGSSYCYLKRIKDGKCNIELSGEEQAALSKAIQGDVNEAG